MPPDKASSADEVIHDFLADFYHDSPVESPVDSFLFPPLDSFFDPDNKVVMSSSTNTPKSDLLISSATALPPATRLGLSEHIAKFDIGEDNMDLQHRSTAERLINDNIDVFATAGQLGNCPILPFKIDTGDNKPLAIRSPRGNFLPARRQLEKEGVEALKQQGLIRPSQSPWAAPVVLVRKSDGSWRFCIDYRAINAVTKKDRFPLPRIDECLSVLGGAAWFSTLDLLSGYYQLRMDPSSIEKTAFMSHEGFYEFTRLPFGLCNAPSHFQRVMQIVLSGLQWNFALVFLDDIIVFSTSFEQHCRDLSIIFARLRQYGLTAKPSKCHLFKRKVKFLGHIISEKGVQQDPAKWSKFRSLDQCRNADEVRSFLGLAGFYHRFVPNFAHIAAPLYHLLGKRIRWKWTEAESAAFHQLKEELYTNRVLVFPDFSKPFRLAVDASQFACGAVLCQLDDEGNERPISFASKVFGPAQRGSAAIVREAFALAWAVEQFRPYVLGAVDFTIFTDHQALTYLWRKTKPVPEGSRIGMALALIGQYNLTITHRPGKDNVVADMWSRVKAMTEDDINALAKLKKPIILDPEEIAELMADARRACEPLKPPNPANEKIVHLLNTDDRAEFLAAVEITPSTITESPGSCNQRNISIDIESLDDPQIHSFPDVIDLSTATRNFLSRQITDIWSPITDTSSPVGMISFDDVAEINDFIAAQASDADLQFALEHGAAYRKNSRQVEFRQMSFLRRQLCRLHPYLVSRDKLIYLRTKPHNATASPQELLLVPSSLRGRLLHLAHDSPTAGHLGSKRTLARLRARFYWPAIARDAITYCNTCTHCVSRKVPSIHRQQHLLPILAYQPFDKIALDFKTVSGVSSKGNNCILVIQDYFTKWVECYALPDQTAQSTANCLLDFISRHGVPRTLLSDQASDFQSELFNRVCAFLQVDKRRTTPYRPQTDGMVERFNRTLDDLFATLTLEHQRDWDDYLPLMLSAYRFTPHTATGFSPFELLYGRSPNMPTNLIAPALQSITPSPDVYNPSSIPSQLDYVTTIQSTLQHVWQQASSNLDAAAQQRIALYNKRVHDRSFNFGDLVLVTRPPPQSATNPKWSPRHVGPFKVVAKLSDHNYRLFNPKAVGLKRLIVVHVDHMLLLRPRPTDLLSPSDLQVLADLKVSPVDTDPTIERATATRKKPSSSRQYTVDRILEHCVDLDQVLWFLVRWRGFTGQSDSWIPESNLKDCPSLVTNYWASVGRKHFKSTAVPAVDDAPASTTRPVKKQTASKSSSPPIPFKNNLPVPLKNKSVPVKKSSAKLLDSPVLLTPPDDLVIVTLGDVPPARPTTAAADVAVLDPDPPRRRSPRLAASAVSTS